jgi:DNA modification methylase
MDNIIIDPHNYRIHGEENKKLISKSLVECGAGRSILVDKNNIVIAGNGVYEEAKELGVKVRVVESDGKELIVVKRTDLSTEDEKRKLLALADNRASDLSEFDFSAIADDFKLDELEDWSFNVEDFTIEDEIKPDQDKVGSLQSRFIIPPFSIFNTTLGYWQDRKKEWLSLGIKSEEGRDKEITFNISSQPPRVYEARNMLREKTGVDPSWDELLDYCNKHDIPIMEGTSIFDPVLCEVIYKWFNIDKGLILDPFAGGSVRGIVASILGYDYEGVDLRKEQIEANYKNANEVLPSFTGVGKINWHTGDSSQIDKIVDCKADLIFSCPPYADLEVYSDDPKDLSNMDYDKFLEAYRTIIQKSCDMLNDNRFAVFVVGEVRNKQGLYYNFVSHTIQAFQDAGLHLYNEIILVNMIGSLAMRAGKQFNNSRKIGKQHQNVLVFYKGDPKKIKENYHELDFSEYDFMNPTD